MFIEVISNTKILYIKFCSMIFPTTKILPNLQGGLDKEGGLDNVEYGSSLSENQTNKSSQSIIIDQSKLTKKLNAQNVSNRICKQLLQQKLRLHKKN